ncbi:MAG: glycosyltransferase family A protein [Candidatus Omnitrophota bacterium]|nr:glycosyltransferase family A protein [Candidatus Omnitrophota bacterium]
MIKKKQSWINKELEPWTPSWILKRFFSAARNGRLYELRRYLTAPLQIICYKVFFKRQKEISAIIRVNNEEEYLYYAIKSIVDYIEEIIIIDNLSTDHSPKIIKSLYGEYPDKIVCFKYPYEVAKLGREHLELVNNAPTSPSLEANYTNWCLKKCTKSYILRWDSDMIATDAFYESVAKFKRSNCEVMFIKGANIYFDLAHFVTSKNKDIKALEATLFPSTNLDNYLTQYTHYEPRIFPKTFSKYNMDFLFYAMLQNPFADMHLYCYKPEAVTFLHLKYCKSDPYRNLSGDIKKIISNNINKGPLLNEDLLKTLKQWRLTSYR